MLELELVLLLLVLEFGLVVTVELESLEKQFSGADGGAIGVGGTERVVMA